MGVLALMVGILALSGVDAFSTLRLAAASGPEVEANPLMRGALEFGPAVFFSVKMGLTAFGLGMLAAGAANGFPRGVRALLAAAFSGYTFLLVYHLVLAKRLFS